MRLFVYLLLCRSNIVLLMYNTAEHQCIITASPLKTRLVRSIYVQLAEVRPNSMAFAGARGGNIAERLCYGDLAAVGCRNVPTLLRGAWAI